MRIPAIVQIPKYQSMLQNLGRSLKNALFVFLIFVMGSCANKGKNNSTWEVTGGSKGNIRYSSLDQIDTANVKNLEVAWVYESEEGDPEKFGPMECNPIIT